MNEDELSNGYYLTKGILVKDDANYPIEIIPIWDSRVTYEDHELYGPFYSLNGHTELLVDVLFNVNTKQLSLGVDIDFYDSLFNFNVGETVYVNVKKAVYKSSIKEIVYNEYRLSIYRGKDLEQYLIDKIKKHYPTLQITVDGLYCIKDWIPYYLLEDDRLVKWEHELFKEFVVK